MTGNVSISIIICTSNRSSALRCTLEAFEMVRIRPDWEAEIIVVDNGSKDDTAIMVRNTKLRSLEVRYLHEAQTGKSRALNAGLAHARGEFILFTDDDVLVAEDWVEQCLTSLVDDRCDAVTGQITLAPHLLRPWMTPTHRWWMASSHDAQPHEGSRELIGANMAFRRSVLERVPAFDVELGPGALGLAEDSLFGWQLIEAGFKTGYAPKARVVHQPDVSRLKRINWLSEAHKHGRTEAYLYYHWQHREIRFLHSKRLSCWLKLQVKRALQRPPPLDAEGCPRWEMSYISYLAFCRQFCLERQRPRNYAARGLTKRGLVSQGHEGIGCPIRK